MRVDSITEESNVIALEKYLKASNERDYVIFKIGTNLGLRVSDFLDIPKKEQALLKENGDKCYYDVKYFRDMCKKGKVCLTQQKTNKPVYFEIPQDIKELILKYCGDRADDEYMFPSRFANKHLTRVGYFLVLKDAAKALGLKENVGCHTMRKIFGYFYYKKYHDIRTLMAIYNHGKEEVTLRYIGISQKEIDESMKNFKVGTFEEDIVERERNQMLELKRKMLKEKKNKKK